MITYCTGSARQKRGYFNGSDDVVMLDNIEVLFCASENGRNYFAYGEVPFASFTVTDYLDYRRALCKDKPTAADLAKFELCGKKRIGSLCAAELRCVMFLEKTCGTTDKTVVVNLDGIKYSSKNAASLARLLSACKDAYVFVTDKRFLPRRGSGYRTLSFGKSTKYVRPKFYAAKLLAKRINAIKVSVM